MTDREQAALAAEQDAAEFEAAQKQRLADIDARTPRDTQPPTNWDFQPPPERVREDQVLSMTEARVLSTIVAAVILAGMAANPSASPDPKKAVKLTDQLLAELAKPSK